MPRRVIEVSGVQWGVGGAGRVTQYTRDECSLVFTRLGDGPREQRVTRFSPLGAKHPELALDELSDADLRALLARAQPAWTSPETGYRA
ncbi:MAG: hypothetical protein NW201_15445 [Gemmatimonadales bacterium]|nr:hypothetical protein [Gemmatimonadales bacterium]